VLGVPCSFTIQLNSHHKARADKALGLVPAKGWTKASCGPGSKGDRLYARAWIATTSPRHHLLVRRNLNDPTDHAYFYCYVPEPHPITLGLLVTVAGMRRPVEEDFQVGKGQFGLDHSQVRRYHALVRHLALAITALAISATTAATMRTKTSTLPPPPTTPDQEPPDDPGLIPLTVPEPAACSPCSPAPGRPAPTTCTEPGKVQSATRCRNYPLPEDVRRHLHPDGEPVP
jgi:hypothetical protein